MHWKYALLAGCALLPCGCFSTVIARDGKDMSLLATRDQVHKDFGTPTASGWIDGNYYEDFETQRKLSEMHRSLVMGTEFFGSYGFSEFYRLPEELYVNGKRLVAGQSVRFEYDKAGKVKYVFLNGSQQPFIRPEMIVIPGAPPPAVK